MIRFLRKTLSLQFVRFAIVGGLSGLTYTFVVIMCQTLDLVSTPLASAFGYLTAIPINFVGQKFYTFKSKTRSHDEMGAFLVVQTANISVSISLMYIVSEILLAHYFYGIAIVILVIPFSSYLALKTFVFVNISAPK